MNTPRSREGNLVRGTIYLIGYFIIFGARRLAISGGKVRLWGGILFFLLSLMMLIFYVYRFNRESRYFQKEEQLLPLTDHFGQLALTTVVIFVLRMLVNYLQLTKGLGLTAVQQSYHTGATSGTFWFMIFAEGSSSVHYSNSSLTAFCSIISSERIREQWRWLGLSLLQ